MSRGHSPKAAISEAKQHASSVGFHVIDVVAPCSDFMISRGDRVALVRVRRVRYRDYDTESIIAACRNEIEELRGSPISVTVARELWVRGPDRTWHRYRIEDGRIVPLTKDMRAEVNPAGGPW
jgi:hypothetical protein